ncbi:uncharacterized protein LOC144615054 [Panthera onca]
MQVPEKTDKTSVITQPRENVCDGKKGKDELAVLRSTVSHDYAWITDLRKVDHKKWTHHCVKTSGVLPAYAIVTIMAFNSCQRRRHIANILVGNLEVDLASVVKELEAHCGLIAMQTVL